MKKIKLKIANENNRNRLVFFNPLGCASGVWSELISEIGSQFELVTYEYPGFNDSVYFCVSSIYEYAEHIQDELSKLPVKPTVLIGYSLGGWVAQQIAINKKILVNGLILLASSQRVHPKGEAVMLQLQNILLSQGIKPFIKELILWSYSAEYFIDNNDFFEYLVAILFERAAEERVYLDQINLALKYTGEQAISKIDCETLIIEAVDDDLYPAFGARELVTLIPRSRLLQVKSGHAILQENLNDVVNKIAPFIKEILLSSNVEK